MEEYSGETVERYDSTNYLTLEINNHIFTIIYSSLHCHNNKYRHIHTYYCTYTNEFTKYFSIVKTVSLYNHDMCDCSVCCI